MKYRHCLAVLSLAATVLSGGQVFAQVSGNPNVIVDENGNGTIQFSGGPVITLAFSLSPDPGPGGLPSVLTYNLLALPSLLAGDVFLQDGVGGFILDVIRFNPAGTGDNSGYPASLLFYSDNVDGFDALADTPSPPLANYPNTTTILEIGPEGDNGAIYTPAAGQPGFVDGFAVTYQLISDAVPEPATCVIWSALAALGFAVGWWRRRRQAA